MAKTPKKLPLRLRRKHGEGRPVDVSAADGAKLVRVQSLRNAVLAGFVAVIVFCFFWVALTSAISRVFPWLTLVLAWMVGMAVRLAGRGVDWRFPALAGSLTATGAVVANIILAAWMTGPKHGTDTLHILQAVTSMTWPVFFDEVWNIGDTFFGVCATALAAFLAPRKLTRRQFHALRLYRHQ